MLSFLYIPISHPCMTIEKTIALTRWTFVSKVMCLHFNMLFMLVITFLPRSKCILIPWLQSPSAETLDRQEMKSATVSIISIVTSPSTNQRTMHELITCPMTLLHTLFKNLPLKDKPFEHKLLILPTWPHIVCLAINTVLSFTASQC